LAWVGGVFSGERRGHSVVESFREHADPIVYHHRRHHLRLGNQVLLVAGAFFPHGPACLSDRGTGPLSAAHRDKLRMGSNYRFVTKSIASRVAKSPRPELPESKLHK